MRLIARLSLGLAAIILLAGLAVYFEGWQGFTPVERRTLAALAFFLLVAASLSNLRIIRSQEKLIADLRASERKSAEFHDLLYTTLCSIGDAVIVTDAKGIIEFFNPAARRISGWLGEAIGQKVDVVLAITDRFTGEKVEDSAAVVLREGNAGALVQDSVITSKDGRLIPVSDSSAPIRNREGNVTGMVLVFRDLTLSKLNEELQLSLASIVQSSEDSIIGHRPDGTITSWNAAASRIFGYSVSEMIGANITVLTPVGQGDDRFEIVKRILRGEHIRHYETVRSKKGGSMIVVDLSISPIRSAAGYIVGASEIARDITDSRRLREQLVYAQKLESLGVLAGGIAHDFNNLLTSVTANAALILDEVADGSAAANWAKNILIATEQGSHLTRQMLHYSGKGRYAVGPLSLNREIENIVSLFRSTIPKKVELRTDLDPSLPQIDADAGQIQQLVTNLVLNGAEAIDSVGVVTVSAALQELTGSDLQNLAGNPVTAGTYVRLEVRDTGKGMDAATQAKIFDPFFTTKFTGRGLGLAAVLGIVRGHNGGIFILSEPGKGTTFQVLLPTETRGRALHAGASA